MEYGKSVGGVLEIFLGGDFIKRDREGLLFSTNSHVKSIAGRVLAVLGVFLLRCTYRQTKTPFYSTMLSMACSSGTRQPALHIESIKLY